MKIVLDTSSLIRYFTNDVPEKAQKVKTLLEQEKNIIIPDVVFPELEYVLTGNYNVRKTELIKIFHFLISRSNIKSTAHIKRAIELFEHTKLDMADCIIAACSQKGTLASFDKELLKLESIKLFWK